MSGHGLDVETLPLLAAAARRTDPPTSLDEIESVPFRAADCDTKTVTKLEKQLRKEVGDKK